MGDKNEGDKTFIKITNRDIYDKMTEMSNHVKQMNGSVGFTRKWLAILTTATGTGFLALLGMIMKCYGK